MCGVAIRARRSSSGEMCGSCSQVSITAAPTFSASIAATSASVSATSPRAALIKTGFFFKASKNAASAMWKVANLPARVSGTCSVTTSASASTSSSVAKPAAPSASALGGSHSNTRQPMRRTASQTRLPTCPTPTTPTVHFSGGIVSTPSCHSPARAHATYCATLPALQPGALAHPMPRLSR